jgi:hypothetical protein
MKGTPTKAQGNIPRQNKNGTLDKSGDGMELPMYKLSKKK